MDWNTWERHTDYPDRRCVEVSDGYETATAPLEPGQTLQQAVEDYRASATYDRETPCTAILYDRGHAGETLQFVSPRLAGL